ncbi:unnamed protein product, partial [Adineta steineri]
LFIAGVIIGVILGTKSKTTKYVCEKPFQLSDPFNTGKYPSSSVLGYFDNDTYLDIAISNSLENSVTLLLGDKEQIFRTTRPATGDAPSSMVVVDLNNDTKIDLVVTNTVGK